MEGKKERINYSKISETASAKKDENAAKIEAIKKTPPSKPSKIGGTFDVDQYEVVVSVNRLNGRLEPGIQGEVICIFKQGDVLSIVSEKEDSDGRWGEVLDIESKNGYNTRWINLGFVKEV